MTTMMIRLCLFVLPFIGDSPLNSSHLALAVDSPTFAYEIRPRPRHLSVKWTEIDDEAKISFDGDVAAIQALALEKAAALAYEEGNANDGTNNGGDLDLIVPRTCVGTSTRNVHPVSFQYIVEYEEDVSTGRTESDTPTRNLQSTQLEEIIEAIETELQIRLADILLVCNTERNEIKEANVVGLLARKPRDENREKQPCEPEQHRLNHSCANVEGRLTLFLGEDVKYDIATYLALLNTETIIEDTSLVTSIDRGLIKVTYLGPWPIAPYESLGSTDSSRSTMSSASIAILSVGVAAAFVFLGGAFAWRRQFSKESTDLTAFGSPGATAREMQGSVEIDEEIGKPTSPLSRMIPSAYQYSDHLSILSGTGLSAVEEVSDSEGTPSVNSTSDYPRENTSIEIISSHVPASMLDLGRHNSPVILFDTSEGGNPNEYSEDGTTISDVSPCQSEDSAEENNVDHQQPNITTSLLMDISSPKGTNTSAHEDEDLLFLH